MRNAGRQRLAGSPRRFFRPFALAFQPRLRPYDLRHAFATEETAAGVDIQTLAQIMGDDLRMLLEHYRHIADKQKKERPWKRFRRSFLRLKITATRKSLAQTTFQGIDIKK
jgi:integrase